MNEKTHILFVDGMSCQNCVRKISDALENVSVGYEVKLEQGSVVIKGNNDAIRAAKNAITQAGYHVK